MDGFGNEKNLFRTCGTKWSCSELFTKFRANNFLKDFKIKKAGSLILTAYRKNFLL